MITYTKYLEAIIPSHCSVIRNILAAIDSDWRECVNFGPYMQVMTSKASTSHFCSNAMLSFLTIAGVLYLLGDYAVCIVHLMKGDNDTSRPFPIKILVPFDAERSPIYELLVIFLFLHAMLNTYTVGILNALIFSLVCFAKFRNESSRIPMSNVDLFCKICIYINSSLCGNFIVNIWEFTDLWSGNFCKL